ncbi:Uncharacterised protein [Klebsiella oxytoca]|nr:Uncharacterised protein [Klebsiella oxytoca]
MIFSAGGGKCCNNFSQLLQAKEFFIYSSSRHKRWNMGNDSNLLIVFYVQIMPDDFVMQLHRF